jgi:ferredoxin-NADP reductase
MTVNTLPEIELDFEVLLAHKEILADGAVRLTLRHPAGVPMPPWSPGAHLDLVLPIGVVRQYSLCGDPANRSELQVAVLREPGGRGGSRFVHDELAAGDTVRIRGPRNHFPLVTAPRYLFIAGGIGVTPILPMVAEVDARGADWLLAYGGRTRSSMAFRAELSERYGDRVHVWPHDEKGLLDLDRLLGTPRADTAVYCCGPEPLLAAVEQLCTAWPPGSLHVERFAPRADPNPGATTGFQVELARSRRTITVPPGKSILRAVEEAGVAVLSSCREGTCGTCETPVLDGVPDHRDSLLSEEEQAANDTMMICVSRARSRRLTLDL